MPIEYGCNRGQLFRPWTTISWIAVSPFFVIFFVTKYATRYRERVNFAINLRSHLCAGIILICYTVLTSPKKGETAVHGCNPTLSVSQCRVGVSQSQLFTYCISALQFCLSTRLLATYSKGMDALCSITTCHVLDTRIEQNNHLPLKSYSPWSLVSSTMRLSHEMKCEIMRIIN